MDPVTVGTTAYGALRVFNACTRGAQDANKSVGLAKRKFRLAGTYNLTWLDRDFSPSSAETGFDAEQLADIGQFLTSPNVTPLLSLLAVTCLTENPNAALIDQVKAGLTNEARKWTSAKSNSWLEHAELIWDRLLELHTEALPTIDSESDWAEDIEYFEFFINTPLQRPAQTPGSHTSRFVKHLISLASDIERLRVAFDTSMNIAQHMATTALDPIITHTDLGPGTSANFDLLYVERSFVDFDDGRPLDSSVITSGNTPFRLVVTGAPGAGKTTYLQHFRRQLCAAQDRPVFVVRCREYAAINWDRTNLPDFMLGRYNSEYSDELEHSTIRDILVLGRAVVVLDGLDEVTDPLRRIDLVRRINALSSMFPLISILVTSREVGYDRAPLDQQIFARVQLKEFELNQALEYVNKWFTVVGKKELIEPFIHDSEAVADLRLNPLMLSLLCMLYRESNAIPSRRLDIYAECARLLFKRWDSHRQIKVDAAIPDFSDSLMQEIARWYYTSPAAQAGLDETVIRGMLKRILIDQSGFPESRAEEAAADFLEFCAGRAWLLGATGSNKRGERLFSFTHKTFSEYFAAEAFSRNAVNVGEICGRITSSFHDDSSSLLPELLIQSYGKHAAQGATRIIKELHERNAPTLLLLRLVEGALLPSHSRRLVFDQLLESWIAGKPDKREFTALLQLNALARDQFVSDHLMKSAHLREIFLSGWATMVLSGLSDRYSPSWSSIVDKIASEAPLKELARKDSAVWSWRATQIDAKTRPADHLHLLLSEGVFGLTPGVAWYGVERLLRHGKVPDNVSSVAGYIDELLDDFLNGFRLPTSFLARFFHLLTRDRGELVWNTRWAADSLSTKEFQLFAYVALAIYEWLGGRPAADRVTSLWSGQLKEVIEVRSESEIGGSPDRECLEAAKQVLRALPDRLASWTIGRDDLVIVDTQDWEDELLLRAL
ncbi:NACHT domain-containing protein [Mycobacterium colombiense]